MGGTLRIPNFEFWAWGTSSLPKKLREPKFLAFIGTELVSRQISATATARDRRNFYYRLKRPKTWKSALKKKNLDTKPILPPYSIRVKYFKRFQNLKNLQHLRRQRYLRYKFRSTSSGNATWQTENIFSF
jgi:hypothetical protein